MIVEIIISIVMLFICICVVYHYFVKQICELENRILVLEKRVEENRQLIKLEIKGVLNNIDLRMKGKKK